MTWFQTGSTERQYTIGKESYKAIQGYSHFFNNIFFWKIHKINLLTKVFKNSEVKR